MYRIFAKVDIRIENLERIPRGENVIFAMNHTDRFNYWPFQYKLFSMHEFPFTTVWVKAKYYKNAFLARGARLVQHDSGFRRWGYLIEEFYRKTFNRKMDRSRLPGHQGYDRRQDRGGGTERARRHRGAPGDGGAVYRFHPGLLRNGHGEGCGTQPNGTLRKKAEPHHLSRGDPFP